MIKFRSMRHSFVWGVTLGLASMLGLQEPVLAQQQPPQSVTVFSTLTGAESEGLAPNAEEFADGAYFREVNVAMQGEIFGYNEAAASTMELTSEPVGMGSYVGVVNANLFTVDVVAIKSFSHHDAIVGATPSQIAFLDSVGAKFWIAHGVIHGTIDSRLTTCLVFAATAPNGSRRTVVLALGSAKVEQSTLMLESDGETQIVDSKLSTSNLSQAEMDGILIADAAVGATTGPNSAKCIAAKQECKNTLVACTDVIVGTAILCLGAILGCAILSVAAWYLCITTGVGCISLAWVAWICSTATVTAIKACLAAITAETALCTSTYAACMLRVSLSSACQGIATP